MNDAVWRCDLDEHDSIDLRYNSAYWEYPAVKSSEYLALLQDEEGVD